MSFPEEPMTLIQQKRQLDVTQGFLRACTSSATGCACPRYREEMGQQAESY